MKRTSHLLFNVPFSKLYINWLMSSLNSRRGWNFGSTTDGVASSDGITREVCCWCLRSTHGLTVILLTDNSRNRLSVREWERRGKLSLWVSFRPQFWSLHLSDVRASRVSRDDWDQIQAGWALTFWTVNWRFVNITTRNIMRLQSSSFQLFI